MIFSTADQLAMITAIGEAVTINGTVTVGDFRLNGAPVLMYDQTIESGRPSCRITSAQVATFSVVKGSTVIARGVTYNVVEINPEQSGFVLLDLNTP